MRPVSGSGLRETASEREASGEEPLNTLENVGQGAEAWNQLREEITHVIPKLPVSYRNYPCHTELHKRVNGQTKKSQNQHQVFRDYGGVFTFKTRAWGFT